MAQAWLDDLSEDWVPQPVPDTSSGQLPPMMPDRTDRNSRRGSLKLRSNRNTSLAAPLSSKNDSRVNILSDNSTNDFTGSKNYTPSRLLRRISKKTDSTGKNSLLSNPSGSGSVVHNTVARHSSPDKSREETPEWKRRLVHGDVAYGEQRDLFCSAAAGLQDMFNPPESSAEKDTNKADETREVALPSSPPMHSHMYSHDDPDDYLSDEPLHGMEAYEQEHPNDMSPSPSPRRQPRNIKYKPNEDESSSFSSIRRDAQQSARPLHSDGIYRDESCLSAPAEQVETSRKPSGQSVMDNESFSEIMIGKHSDQDGKIDFAPIEMPADQLKQKLERLRITQTLLSPEGNAGGVPVQSPNQSSVLHDTSHGFGQQGGGRSTEGYFRHRAFSPGMGLGGDSSAMLPDQSLQASTPKQFPTVRIESFDSQRSPTMPRAPYPSPEKQTRKPHQPSGGGSPLKLFGPYDTFTNQTLLRRISQFEDSGSAFKNSPNPDNQTQPLPTTGNRAFVASPIKVQMQPDSSPSHDRSQFGDGDLADYEFRSDPSLASLTDFTINERLDGSTAPTTDPSPAKVTEGEARIEHEADAHQTRGNGLSLARGELQRKPSVGRSVSFGNAQHPRGTPRRDVSSEKRPRTSPAKDPTPKRRRTLHKSDIAYAKESLARRVLLPRKPDPSARGSSRDGPVETDRKPSIRTQDFVDQAAQIMAMIRSQVRPQGLASVEESELESGNANPAFSDDSGQDSFDEPFSRPPSREGAPVARVPMHQEDPDLLDRLRKYQERSDMGDIITSSLRSMDVAKQALYEAQEIERQIDDNSRDRPLSSSNHDEVITSDIPNVRLSGGLMYEPSPSKHFDPVDSYGSTYRSFPSSSSRASDSRKIIMPESVSHLIPERVGSMFLDKSNNIWIKKKGEVEHSVVPLPSSDDSEDDPFASIPDLTVDMTKEMQNLRLATEKRETVVHNIDRIGSPTSPLQSPSGWQNNVKLRNISPQEYEASGRERVSSYDFAQEGLVSDAANELPTPRSEREDSAELPALPPKPSPATKPRNMTIAFSSPIASIIQEVVAEDLDSMDDDDEDASEVWGDQDNRSFTRASHTAPKQNPGSFVPRPVSRISEHDEDSTVEMPYDDQRQLSIVGDTSVVSHKTPGARHSSVSILFNGTPGHHALSMIGDESAVIGHHVGKLSLSPLSEFTLNPNTSDQSFGLEVSYVMGRRHLETGDGSRRVMSMTIRELVDRLSEAEPCEPYWEDMTSLDLCEKRLSSLHMLDEFCGSLVTLDASENKLAHLAGVPGGVRHLKVANNLLTELTSWDHLLNLQYVDVSGNEVKSLSALKNLVHLRSVKADNNQLTSLDGLDGHDGLLSLRLRDNHIEELDLGLTKLDRLSELDLTGNQISVVRNLDQCPGLSKLKLGNNVLDHLSPSRPVQSLRHLDLSDNCLITLDVARFPNLHSLHADRNCITTITGFARCRRLDSLSVREQCGEDPLDMSFLSHAYEVRKLFLSGNCMDAFEPKVDFLNLQLLDLANCGLRELPWNMGQIMPNLRTLNVNFNAISDLSPLRFVPRVKKLLVAGNRLGDSTAVTQLLTEFPHLTTLDLRDNPVTLGFYPSSQVVVPTDGSSSVDPFSLPDADPQRDEMFSKRLDEATKLRRRLHHVVFAASCGRLKRLDGLPLNRHLIMARDQVLETLIADGLLPDIGKGEERKKEEEEEKNEALPVSPKRTIVDGSPLPKQRTVSPRVEQRPVSPRVEQRPASPRVEQRPASPRIEERPRSPPVEPRTVSPPVRRHIVSPRAKRHTVSSLAKLRLDSPLPRHSTGSPLAQHSTGSPLPKQRIASPLTKPNFGSARSGRWPAEDSFA